VLGGVETDERSSVSAGGFISIYTASKNHHRWWFFFAEGKNTLQAKAWSYAGGVISRKKIF